MKKTLGLRVDADEEFAGLDVAEHGTSGYGVNTSVVHRTLSEPLFRPPNGGQLSGVLSGRASAGMAQARSSPRCPRWEGTGI